MDRLGIDCLSVFGMPPVDFVNLAADLGCRHISTVMQSSGFYNPHGYPEWSLRDPATRREMIAAMRDRGVSISLGEGLVVLPNRDVRNYAADLDAMCALGVKRIATVGIDPDRKRTLDQLAALAEMANGADVEMVLEFVPIFTISDLPDAIETVRRIGQPNVRILVDTMHLIRSGSSAADVAALDPDMIGYIQLCDVPLAPEKDYLEESMYERMIPGTGELPLLDILSALPRRLVIGLETPLRSRAEAGEGPSERMGQCVKAARRLLAKLDEPPGSNDALRRGQ